MQWRATVAFRVYEELMKRLLEYEFYCLTLHMWRIEPNREPAEDALRNLKRLQETKMSLQGELVSHKPKEDFPLRESMHICELHSMMTEWKCLDRACWIAQRTAEVSTIKGSHKDISLATIATNYHLHLEQQRQAMRQY